MTTYHLPPADELARLHMLALRQELSDQRGEAYRPHRADHVPCRVFLHGGDDLRLGAVVAVNTFGGWRYGIVVKVGTSLVHVAYVTPAAPSVVRVAREPFSRAYVRVLL